YTYLDGVPRPSGRKGNIVMFGIRAKLLAAFVAVALFTAALGWYTVGGMARLNADQRTLYGRARASRNREPLSADVREKPGHQTAHRPGLGGHRGCQWSRVRILWLRARRPAVPADYRDQHAVARGHRGRDGPCGGGGAHLFPVPPSTRLRRG